MKLTKSRLKRIIKEELNKVLESNEMVYGGGSQEPTYDDLANSSGVVKDYLAAMLAQPENFTQHMPGGGKKHMSEILKLIWDFMRDNPGDTEGGVIYAMEELGFDEYYARRAVERASGANSIMPTGDMMMNAVQSKKAMGPVAVDARSGYRGSF
jgi:hypothetical protein